MDLLYITDNLVTIELPGSEISSATIGTEQGPKKDVILLYFATGSELGPFTFFGSLGVAVLFKLAVLLF